MSPREVIVAVLLLAGVAVELLCCLGVALMRGPFNRLHFLGPATSLGPLLLALAVVLQTPTVSSGVKALIVAAVMFVSGPVLTHATARAARARDQDGRGAELPEDSP